MCNDKNLWLHDSVKSCKCILYSKKHHMKHELIELSVLDYHKRINILQFAIFQHLKKFRCNMSQIL